MDTVLVLNFGGQYCHLIARRIRESGVYSEIVPHDFSEDELKGLSKNLNVKGIVLSGGPLSIYQKGAPQMDKRIIGSGLPILGICYGHQLLAHYLNGKVVRAKKEEYGSSQVLIDKAAGVLNGLSKRERTWMSHGDEVVALPKSLESLAHTASCPVAAFMDKRQRLFGVQWHPEVMHTKNGKGLLDNFVFSICKSVPTWKAERSAARYVKEIKDRVRGGTAILAMSGGIDSSTAAVLSSKALGKRCVAVFVDTGLMRSNEPEQIMRMAKRLGINLLQIDARKAFTGKLKGVTNPEEKRRIIGREFIRIFESAAKGINAAYLIQGTIYPDRIESGSLSGSSTIKTHHNVGGLPTSIDFKDVIEPLRDLYKDEVRQLAFELGIPKEIVCRQPFPGPGLAVRIIGSVSPEKIKMLRTADAIVTEEIEKAGYARRLWQYFAVLTDTKSTGVKGDSRAYGRVISIRTVESVDAMTANFARLPYSILEGISTRITSEIPGVVRVVYDVTHKPPSTIEWE